MAMLVLADDDEDLRAVYAQALGAAGFALHEAADGDATLDLVRSLRPELLLLDLWMPRRNGFEVLDALRHDGAAARTRVVVLSNLDDADSRLEAFARGASAYLVKGLALADLIAEVGRALADPSPPG